MKKLIVMLAVCLGVNTTVNAQEMQKASEKAQKGGMKRQDLTPEQRAEKGAKWAEKTLGLNADQKSKWQAAALTRIQANAPHRDVMRGQAAKEEKQKSREAIKGNMQTFDTTVSGFLTPEQKTKWDQIKQKRKEAHKMKKENKVGKADKVTTDEDHELKDVDQE
ncbi:MAG: hypothetical protein QM534_09225 [Sediminibacterium sp.]|nr:hypothetical protein [Sediminibacterium sp.]